MASRYAMDAGFETPQDFKSDDYRDEFDHDTAMLLTHASVVKTAASILYKEQKNIRKKQQKSRSKRLPKCKEKYRNSFDDLKTAVQKLYELVNSKDDISATQKQLTRQRKFAQSWHDPKKGKERHQLEERTFEGQQNQCMHCLSKDRTIEDLRKELRSFNDMCRAYDELLKTNENERQQRERYERMYKDEKTAKDDALERLSSMASSKLRDNNPNIADLSDQNRPTKIAEKLSELYDNQWTDAYDALERKNMEERQIIKTLLDILMNVYGECSRLATDNFFERVQRSIELPIEQSSTTAGCKVVLPDQLKQQIKEFRKTRALAVAKEIETVVKKRIRNVNQLPIEVQPYISRCIEIGWSCVVQDPPLVFKAQTSAAFDTSSFKEYTSRGAYTAYVVWPALYLHDEGPLLGKGVAQGSNQPETSNRETPRGQQTHSRQNDIQDYQNLPRPANIITKQNIQTSQPTYYYEGQAYRNSPRRDNFSPQQNVQSSHAAYLRHYDNPDYQNLTPRRDKPPKQNVQSSSPTGRFTANVQSIYVPASQRHTHSTQVYGRYGAKSDSHTTDL